MDSSGASGIKLLPIPTAFTGEACLSCCKQAGGSGEEERLVRCTRCQRAKYCNGTCQRADWSQHKKECKPLKKFRDEYTQIPRTRTVAIGDLVAAHLVVVHKAQLFENVSCPAIKDNARFRKFVNLSKLCAICGKSEYDFGPDHKWYSCTTCHFGWCCSQEHFDDYQTNIHSQNKICHRFVQSTAVDTFHWRHFRKYKEKLSFSMPESSTFRPPFQNFPADWNTLFQLRCGDYPLNLLPPEFLPASTLELSQVFTCLYAMYQHKKSLERFFFDKTSKETLTIHVVGPTNNFELMPTGVWEEIMHFLPCVGTFNLVCIGPDATKGMPQPCDRLEYPAGNYAHCCPTCKAHGRQRGFYLYGTTYHDYYRNTATLQQPPDLIVAFNTGMSEEETDSWKTSLELMLDLDVPALFTSFNQHEAKADYALLSSVMGAKMLTTEPVLNPVRVAYDFIDPGCEGGAADPFYQPNMYALCFQGRERQAE